MTGTVRPAELVDRFAEVTMSKPVLDRARRAPRNGVSLSADARANVSALVERLVLDLHAAATALVSLRDRRGSRAWRRECMTVEQRRALRAATKDLRAQAKRWV